MKRFLMGAAALALVSTLPQHTRAADVAVATPGKAVSMVLLPKFLGILPFDLAHQWGVRVYSIAIRPTTQGDFEQQVVGELELLSLETNGVASVATDGSVLRSIYSEIDHLEKSDMDVVKLESNWGAFTVLVFAAFAMLAAEVLLNQTWLRRIP